MEEINQHSFTAGTGRNRVQLNAFILGNDLQIIISGGDVHVGAVALGVPYDDTKSSISILAVSGHKEDRLVFKLAELISRQLQKTTVITMGIHYDDLSGDELQRIIENTEILTHQLVKKLRD